MYNIKNNSKKVLEGDTFVAIKGHTVDGHNYIEDAIKRGAKKIICEHGEYEVETVVVENSEKYITNYLVETYKDMLKEINFVGITGTNGKTTTCYLAYQMLNKLGVKTAYIGTIGFYLDDFEEESLNTTPDIVMLYEYITKAYEAGFRNIVMEVCSHSLDLGRTEGINFEVGGYTNLTQDHLDYHKTMELYLETKKRLVPKCKKMVINGDDQYSKEFTNDNTLTVGFEDTNDIVVKQYENLIDGVKVNFTYNNENYEISPKVKGKYNITNFLMCIGICMEYKDINDIIAISSEISAPKGRCELISLNGGVAVVDYAHTPDAVQKIIDTFKEEKEGRIITVVGCGGDRDPVKRPIMGKIASDNSDYCIFTSDNPRTEDPKLILEDVVRNVEKDNYEVQIDRTKAISSALDLIKENDKVLILGKGHEDYQIIGHEKIHMDDAQIVRDYIKGKNN
ncbi:MAG: UDP-N-acetylmuramoyl-L-alanyl-D-glutamate--2,6-diaminopimelate ligase [bacterium]